MAKILIIEDEASIRTLIRYDLKNLGHQVVEAEDGNTGLDLARSEDFSVILLDWMLPGLSGIAVAEKLRLANYNNVLIMLTAKDNEEDIIQAFDAGVDDYVTKPFSPRELTARISAHLRRLNQTEDGKKGISAYGNISVNSERRSVSVDNITIELTKTEYELLVYLLNNKEIVLSRDAILSQVWGFAYDGDTRIVDVHIFKLRSKLKDADVEITANRGIGYILQRKC